jgi:hypothetical protein
MLVPISVGSDTLRVANTHPYQQVYFPTTLMHKHKKQVPNASFTDKLDSIDGLDG